MSDTSFAFTASRMSQKSDGKATGGDDETMGKGWARSTISRHRAESLEFNIRSSGMGLAQILVVRKVTGHEASRSSMSHVTDLKRMVPVVGRST